MSYLDRILACRRHDLAHFRPLVVDDRTVGWVRQDLADALAAWPRVFVVNGERVGLAEGLRGFDARSAAVEAVLRELESSGRLPAWRDEDYGVGDGWGSEPLFKVDRCAVTALGVRAYGIHVNAFVQTEAGIRLWVAKRSDTAHAEPGKLDHLVAGGQSFGLGLRENVEKEADEEAGVPAELARQAIPVGMLGYRMEVPLGLRHDTLFLWDLELPADFEPVNRDGEAQSFALWPLERVAETVRESDVFKFNVAPVIVDFLVRHGWLGPEEPDYVEIVRALGID